MNMLDEIRKRTESFLHDRFGMFIHWGLYAIPARGEWVRSIEQLSLEEYEAFFQEFDPVHYKPKEWAKLAKQAGMKYAVLTVKHHDGFCLFDSAYTDYKATNTKAARDLVREYVEAFREEGLNVGFYYSLLDWHHPDYPVYNDPYHPMRGNEAYKDKEQDFGRYLEYLHNQVRELCTNYGKIDIMWFDFSYKGMSGQTWNGERLVRMVRELQPGIIIDNRLEASGESYGSLKSSSPTICSGDFASPEQVIPPYGVVNELGESIPWESCITMNNHWGYCVWDKQFKSPKQIIRKLVECVSKNGNLLLNVGPDAKGAIPEKSVEILKEIGQWMKRNGDSIYGCHQGEYPKPEWGYFTQRENLLYAHIFDGNIGALPLLGLKAKVQSIRLVSDGSQLKAIDAWNLKEYPEDLFINFGPEATSTYPLPDDIDTVVMLELKE